MTALIIGAAGFVGGYLARHLRDDLSWDVSLTKLPSESIEGNYKTYDLDILDEASITALLLDVKPQVIFHLAAQSSVAVSWKKPRLTAAINIEGCINLLEAVRGIEGYNPRILLIGSGEEYGYLPKGVSLVSETTPINPGNPYAATKAAQNMFGALYAKSCNMDIVMVRAFNHIGVGQLPQFVAADFCRQAAEIKEGLKENVIRTGNLCAKRDFTDVRDIVRAYGLLALYGRAGETYNAGSGKSISIQELLDTIIEISGCDIRHETDPERMRPSDIPEICADISKLTADTGWKPEIPLRATLSEMVEHCLEIIEKQREEKYHAD